MKWSRWQIVLVLATVALIWAGLRQPSVTAQGAPAQPAISLRRVTAFNQQVVPGDFNGDGILDIASTGPWNGSSARVVIALGKGDGTFGATTATSLFGVVMSAVDINGDGKLDLLVADGRQPDSDDVFFALGNGDGTFTTTRPVSGFDPVRFAQAVDLDGDGVKDVIVGSDGSIVIFPGQADGTYPNSIAMHAGSEVNGLAVADINGDGRLDLIVANHAGRSLSIFRNNGSFSFSASDIPLGEQVNDVIATDLDHDGRLDLVAATSTDGSDDLYYVTGSVKVLRGNGNGTFQTPVDYATAPGAWRIVAGDFNRDGITDIATANRSAKMGVDFCGHSWDSVTILPGLGDGRLAAGSHSTFSLGNQSDPGYNRFQTDVLSLVAADLNRDGATDLVASWGAILLNHAPDTNWPPTPNAGSDQSIRLGESLVFQASVSDVDQDMVTYTWTDTGGHAIEPSPRPCALTPAQPGVYTMEVTVDDGHGHLATDSFTYTVRDSASHGPLVSITAPASGEVVAAGQPYPISWNATAGSAPIQRFDLSYSTDDGSTSHPISECQQMAASARGCVWQRPPVTEQARVIVVAVDTNGVPGTSTSGRFAIRVPSSGMLGSGWSHADVGHVGAAGSASYDGLVYEGEGLTVTGSGADIWGTADAFHFAWKQFSGDFSIDTRVSSLDHTNAWAKAGLMIRAAATDASSAHASIFVSPSKGIAFQRRMTMGGSSVSTQGPALTAPLWFRMTRQGTLIRAFYRKNITDAWTELGEQSIAGLGGAVDVGLATTSHADGTLASAKFGGVFVGALPVLTTSRFGGATGTISGNGTTFTATGSGSDIWGTSDSFVFFNAPIGENRQITVRVRSLGNTDAWAKAGVMIRESLSAGSRHADLIVSPSKGIALQDRGATGGVSASPVQMNGAAPIWLRLSRFEPSSGTPSFTATYSPDGSTWYWMGSVNVTMAHGAYVGIALTSHKAGTETTAIVDDIRIEQ